MANEMFTQLPTVANSQLTDIICAVQGYVSPSSPGTSVQQSLSQLSTLFQQNVVLSFPGNPNGNVAGTLFQFCYNTVGLTLFICTTAGSTSTAIWTQVTGFSGLVTPSGGGTGVVNPTAHTIPVAEGVSNFNFLGPLTNGQLLIGSSGLDPVPANITAGMNISVTNSAGGITIAATGSGGFNWTHVTSGSQQLASNSGYVIDNGASLVTLTLPLASAIGDQIDIVGRSAGLWKVVYTIGQNIILGSTASTVTTGNIASTRAADSLTMICTQTNNEWTVLGSMGNITIV